MSSTPQTHSMLVRLAGRVRRWCRRHTELLVLCAIAVLMSVFGVTPRAEGPAGVVYLCLMGVGVLIGLVGLIRLVFVMARPVEAVSIEGRATPILELRYRRRRVHAGLCFVVGGLFATPLLVVWPAMGLLGMEDATNPGMPLLCAFGVLMSAMMFVTGRRGWYAGVTIFPDRLAVRGQVSGGSLRWDEVSAFIHAEKQIPGRWHTLWLYYVLGAGRWLMVQHSIESPEEFVREVESRTGLTLEKVPLPME